MEATKVERKYALIKLDKGDWLLPGNDGREIWRLRREWVPQYDEDGELLPPTSDRRMWHLYKSLVRPEVLGDRFCDAWGEQDWEIWEGWGYFETRADAIQDALT
jgi:hypothetical protein